jgi:hypothetical protein
VANAGAPGHGAPGGGPIPPALQRAISHALADVGPLTFATSADGVIMDRGGCAHVRGQGILITLGPVQGAGEQVQVGVNGFVACLGANSLTYRVERTSGGWRVAEVAAWGRSPEEPPAAGRQSARMRAQQLSNLQAEVTQSTSLWVQVA